MAIIEFEHKKTAVKMLGVHVHTKHELYYLAKGATKYLIDDEIYPVQTGNIVFIPKGHYHMTDNGEYKNIERYLLSFDDNLFDSDTRVILDELSEHRLISISVNHIEEVESLFDRFKHYVGMDGELGDAVRKIHALAILSFICRHKKEVTPEVSDTDRIAHQVSEYISANYCEELSLSVLSRKFSISESHLSRKFKEVVGIGLNEYITFVRIINAERLLREGKHSITEVATECGFNDPNYFSTVFKKLKGVTPLKFAKNTTEHN